MLWKLALSLPKLFAQTVTENGLKLLTIKQLTELHNCKQEQSA